MFGFFTSYQTGLIMLDSLVVLVINDHPVISGVPQGTVLGPLLFLITISDINKDISSSKLISFADDTRIYSKISDVLDCDNLQFDLNMIYDWASTNNMFFNAQKFHYVSFNTDPTENLCNVYVNPKMDIIPHSSNKKREILHYLFVENS